MVPVVKRKSGWPKGKLRGPRVPAEELMVVYTTPKMTRSEWMELKRRAHLAGITMNAALRQAVRMWIESEANT